jgi:hypothetical protein
MAGEKKGGFSARPPRRPRPPAGIGPEAADAPPRPVARALVAAAVRGFAGLAILLEPFVKPTGSLLDASGG